MEKLNYFKDCIGKTIKEIDEEGITIKFTDDTYINIGIDFYDDHCEDPYIKVYGDF